MKRILAIALLSLCALTGWAQEVIVIESAWLHRIDSILVVSPEGKTCQRELPTLILLHGFGGNYRDWSTHADLQGLSNKTGFRFVCPEGFERSWYLNNANPSGMQWRKFFWEECWPALQERFGLNPERTFVDGLSMGGHGAMNLFLDHPDRFKAAGAMSGILDLRHSGGSREIIPGILGVDDIEADVCQKESAVNRLGRLRETGSEGKLMVVSCGTKDKFLKATEVFDARCREEGLRCVAIYSPAAHRWPYWVKALPYHLQFFMAEL